MKFICYKNDLNEALQFAMKAVAVKPMTPVLSGIYIRAEGAVLELQANNYSTGIIVKIPAKAEIPGETVVGGKRLQDFVRNMPGDMITFSDENDVNILSMRSGDAKVELMTMLAEEFPKVKQPNLENSFRVRTTVLQDLIQRTVFAVSKDDSRPVFTGCCFEIKGDKISLVATNTHRLAYAVKQLAEEYPDTSFVVPAETLRSLMIRLANASADTYITVSYSERYLTFAFENIFVNARLIEGAFPPYDRVIPKSSTTQVTVDIKDFRKAVELIALMSKETEYNTVKFTFTQNGIAISSTSPEVGDANTSVEAQVTGDDLEISFNAEYVLDVLKILTTTRVSIELNDRYSPAAFTEPDDPNYIYVVTPVRA
ncbi:MAG: DNA polymerase III subunit beta [Quinella sp. 1Q7]|nr:DNA polymerase III subunit beta [Quinella sp. 1Q7]